MVITDNIWQDFLLLIKQEVGSRIVETWFKVLTFKTWDNIHQKVYLEAPNAFVKEWVSKHYIDLFQIHLGRLLHVDLPTIVILDHSEIKKEDDKPSITLVPARSIPSERVGLIRTGARKAQTQINNNYKFDTFVVGPSNSLAYAAAHAITEKPGKLYNPLFIYGGSGLGKTHLLHAIGNEIQARHKPVSILYQTADRFVNEFIDAIRFDKVYKFQSKYHTIDLLLIDDLQFISNKEQTQEAFFHIFNSLYDAHKQIVFSSDTYPQNMHGIAERLRSRIAGGLVTDIHIPSIETKIAILKRKALTSDEYIVDEVLEFIASLSIGNIRELEGALIRVIAYASLSKEPITLELAKKVLARMVPAESPRTIDFHTIINVLTNYYPYSLSDLRSKNRNKELAFVRQLAMHLMKYYTDKSLRDIGEYLGNRDHSTVMHGITKVQDILSTNKDLASRIHMISQDIVNR